MQFNSLNFLIFFPVVTVLYFLLPHRFRWIHLLIASCIFYITFIPVYILILFFTIIIDYLAGIWIENASGKRRKMFLLLSIVANVGVLAVFKYYNFFVGNMNEFLAHFHIVSQPIPLLNIILPIGLSFHTFQAMSYTIEVYRGNQKAERHLGIYSLYVMFYPQLVAGPIERPQNLLYQFREEHHFDGQALLDGLRLMLWGLFKKLVIADRLANYVNLVYGEPAHYHYLNLIIATMLFSIEIYCDFSGYSDIAIGAARVMGFDLMTNFNRPLLSRSITELWRKWHISLTTWFTDYLYMPFVTAKRDWGKTAIVLGVLMTFMISGLWHGAGWTFVIYGAVHGIALVYEILTQKYRKKLTKAIPAVIYTPFTVLLTFCYFSFCVIFFRAANLHDAFLIVKHIFTFYHEQPFSAIAKNAEQPFFSAILRNTQPKPEFGGISFMITIVMCTLLFVTESRLSVKAENINSRPILDLVFLVSILTIVVLFGVFFNYSFIYFQF